MNYQKFFELYNQLSDKQKQVIFGENKQIIDKQNAYDKLFSDTAYNNVVQTAVGESVYEELTRQV